MSTFVGLCWPVSKAEILGGTRAISSAYMEEKRGDLRQVNESRSRRESFETFRGGK